MSTIHIHPEVEDALAHGRAVVALESAVITHGLPREPLDPNHVSRLAISGWDRSSPTNLELARAMQRTVREGGAVAATMAVLNGSLHIGLDDDELATLARDQSAEKASIADLASIMSRGGSAGTTVSATLAACAAFPIRVFATGGIGGVHKNWQRLPDISADLRAIATTPICIVCSGAKSILDLPATLEALQTLGVPVIGMGTNRFAQFQCLGSDDLTVAHRCDSIEEVAAACHMHWDDLHLKTGVIVANEVPAEFALPAVEFQTASNEADRVAAAQLVTGSALTPFLLSHIAWLTGGRSLVANIALLINNAKLAAKLAMALASAQRCK